MFTHAQFQAWSALHLKTGCWYLDCAKGFCHKDEEDLEKSIDIASGTIDLTATSDVEDEQEDDQPQEDKKRRRRRMKRRKRGLEKGRRDSKKRLLKL